MDLAQATPRTRAALTRQQQQLVKHIQGKPERSINRQDVLTEEEYVEALEKIIARDFFPLVSERLKQREQEQEILAGFHSQDPDVIERSVRHMEHLASQDPAWSSRIGRRNVQDTPRYGADTPSGRSIYGETPVALDPGRSSAAPLRYNSDLSLDTFQSQYTSEDNASFADIMEQENAARKTRYAWAYKAEHNASDKSQRAIEARQQLVDLSRRLAEGDSEVRLIEGSEPGRPGQRLLIEGRTTLPGDTASLEFAKRRVIAAAPKQERLMIEGASNSSARQEQLQERETQLTLALSEQKDAIDKARQESEIGTGVTAWPFTARNNFYYAPDANIPIQDTSKQSLPQPSGSKSASDSLGSIAPKGIRYNMTRLIDDDDLDEQARRAGVPPSPSHSNIAAAISGTPYPGRNAMTPRVQGYSFVDAMPSPSPSEIGSDNVNSLMTLGTLASTPVALRNPNEDDPVFKAPAPPRPAERQDYGPFSKPSRRDELARQMASKASRSLAQRQSLQGKSSGLGLLRFGERSGTASPSSVSTTTSIRDPGATPGKDAYLSPAARTLLGRASGSSIRVESKSELRKRERQMDQDRERASQEKLKRQKWDASPLRNAS